MRGLTLILVAGVFGAQTAAAGTATWHEDFEGTTCGALPAGWTFGGGNTELGSVWDVGSIVCQGSHALGFFGVIGGCWAALAAAPVAPGDDAYATQFTLEFSVRVGDETTSGCYGGSRAYVELNALTSWTGDHRGLLVVGNNGELTGSGLALGTVPLRTCHRIRIDYLRVDPTSVSLTYMVDGTPAGMTTLACGAGEDTLRYLHFGALEGSAWFDDITVQATTNTVAVEGDTWAKQKALYRE
jgi:hypothetical protein